MGSVSRKVLSHAPCPVFIVKDPIQTPVQVVLAVDGSTASMACGQLPEILDVSRFGLCACSFGRAPNLQGTRLKYPCKTVYQSPEGRISKTSSRNGGSRSIAFFEEEIRCHL